MKPKGFPETSWPLVRRAGSSDDNRRHEALSELLTIYTPALRSFLTELRRIPADIADDILHDFILDKFVARKLLRCADERRGKFRNLVLKSLTNYSATWLKRESKVREKEIEFDESVLSGEPPVQDLERFDRDWATQVVVEAIQRLEKECRERDRLDLWTVFDLRIVRPLVEDVEPADYETIVTELNIETPRQAINLLTTAKRSFLRHLRDVVRPYSATEEHIEHELGDLRKILSR